MREPTDQEILDILQEECAEVIHIVSKIRRFGMYDKHPTHFASNYEKFAGELKDLLAMIQWTDSRYRITGSAEELATSISDKHDKVRRYLRDDKEKV